MWEPRTLAADGVAGQEGRMNMGELFAGIGGFSLGFRRAGFDVKWQVEIDPYCRKVLQKNFPEAERFDDVRTVGAANLQPVDVICGGWPCQDISNAGRHAGLAGERSGLFFEFARIIDEIRPKFAVLENVAALLGRGMGRVLGTLADIGYDAEWARISAADFRAPHLRERVWIVAYPQSEQVLELSKALVFANSERIGQPRSRQYGAPIDSQANPFREAGGIVDAFQRGALPYVCRRHDGIPASMDRQRGCGNAVVPQIPEWIANRILAATA